MYSVDRLRRIRGKMASSSRMQTYGSPITKLSPVLIEGIKPREPTRAAAASLLIIRKDSNMIVKIDLRKNIAIEIGSDHDVEYSNSQSKYK